MMDQKKRFNNLKCAIILIQCTKFAQILILQIDFDRNMHIPKLSKLR